MDTLAALSLAAAQQQLELGAEVEQR